MTTMPVCGGPVNGGVHQADDRVGEYLPGEAEGEIPVPRLRGRDCKVFLGGTPSDPAWMGESTSVGGGPAASRGIQDLLPTYGRDSGMPIQGMQGWAKSWAKLQVHFLHHPVTDKIVILKESSRTHPL